MARLPDKLILKFMKDSITKLMVSSPLDETGASSSSVDFEELPLLIQEYLLHVPLRTYTQLSINDEDWVTGLDIDFFDNFFMINNEATTEVFFFCWTISRTAIDLAVQVTNFPN